MGYQEVLVRSSKMTLENIAHIIQKKADMLFINSANTIATLQNNFSSDKTIIFGQQIETKPVSFCKGEQFLVVCGERDALKSIKSMLPLMQRQSFEIYPVELVMQSPENINKKYKDVFSDSCIFEN